MKERERERVFTVKDVQWRRASEARMEGEIEDRLSLKEEEEEELCVCACVSPS